MRLANPVVQAWRIVACWPGVDAVPPCIAPGVLPRSPRMLEQILPDASAANFKSWQPHAKPSIFDKRNLT